MALLERPLQSCERCGVSFQPIGPRAKYCSDLCRWRVMGARQRAKRAERTPEPEAQERTCEVCGGSYRAQRPWARYCSPACHDAARLRRVREEREAGQEIVTRTCERCGTAFVANRLARHYRFCGACRRKPAGLDATKMPKVAKKAMALRIVPCAFCGAQFATTRPLQRFCTLLCGRAASHERERVRKKARLQEKAHERAAAHLEQARALGEAAKARRQEAEWAREEAATRRASGPERPRHEPSEENEDGWYLLELLPMAGNDLCLTQREFCAMPDGEGEVLHVDLRRLGPSGVVVRDLGGGVFEVGPFGDGGLGEERQQQDRVNRLALGLPLVNWKQWEKARRATSTLHAQMTMLAEGESDPARSRVRTARHKSRRAA